MSSIEDVESFRIRCRKWIRDNLERLSPEELTTAWMNGLEDDELLAAVDHDRTLQRMFFDAGFAGICFPREYGGQGLTPEHQRAFNQELAGYEYPRMFAVPTGSPCAAILLEFGTEEQKRRHIPAILKGEEIWAQFLSEPGGGSDVAGASTTAVRDGDEWILNGSKVWTSRAWVSDWALCLARTNWDVPKHRGLSVFILPIQAQGVDVHRIEELDGARNFCQEFLTDVRVPDTDRIGDVDDGWTVGRRWMFHERMSGNSPYVTFPVGIRRGGVGGTSLVAPAREAGRLDDPHALDLVGEARTLDLVARELERRLGQAMSSGKMNEHAAAIGRLFSAAAQVRQTTIAFDIGGTASAIWSDEDGATARLGRRYLMRQAPCIGGGTVEIARNVVSERLLGMPREQTYDKAIPFRDEPRGPAGRR